MIRLKSKEEISQIKKAGLIVSKTLDKLSYKIKAGITTYELDKITHDFIIEQGGKPAFKDYRGFPASICTSIDNVIVHGIPSKKTVLCDGSIIGIDVGVELNGYFADSAYTFAVGKIGDSQKKLIEVTKKSFPLFL